MTSEFTLKKLDYSLSISMRDRSRDRNLEFFIELLSSNIHVMCLWKCA